MLTRREDLVTISSSPEPRAADPNVCAGIFGDELPPRWLEWLVRGESCAGCVDPMGSRGSG